MSSSIKDERIKFYLEHEDRIKEWAAIEKEIPELAHRFYLTLKTGSAKNSLGVGRHSRA